MMNMMNMKFNMSVYVVQLILLQMFAYQIGRIANFMKCRAGIINQCSLFRNTHHMQNARNTINAIHSFPPLVYSSRFGFATTIDIDSQQTFNLLIKKLNNLVDLSNELNEMMIDDGTQAKDYSKKQMSKDQIRKELNKLAPAVTLHQEVSSLLQNIKDLEEMIKQTTSQEEKAILSKDMKDLHQKKKKFKDQCINLLIPQSAFDDVNEVTMEFKPGAGGMESSIFVQDISEMYINFCEGQGWRVITVSAQKQTGTSRGYKSLSLKVIGQNVHKILKCESGVHKVIRVPQTQAKGRLHSSTISVVIMPTVPFNFQVDNKDIKYQFTRSSGPGGQGVNKTQSACRATHIPTGLAVFIQQDRSQQMNKRRATQILKERVFEIEYQKVMQNQSQTRKSQVTTMDRSQKIRTYNYPQGRITDHRTGLTMFGIDDMMKGQYLQKFIDAFVDKVNKEKLDAMLAQLAEENK